MSKSNSGLLLDLDFGYQTLCYRTAHPPQEFEFLALTWILTFLPTHPSLISFDERNTWFWDLACFHENGRISLNSGPILKIQNLPYSGEQCPSVQREISAARDDAREMTSRARSITHDMIQKEKNRRIFHVAPSRFWPSKICCRIIMALKTFGICSLVSKTL